MCMKIFEVLNRTLGNRTSIVRSNISQDLYSSNAMKDTASPLSHHAMASSN